ncbi:MAG: hypothetical protein V7642_444, partial [Burkholderiales bacterium]
MRASLEYASLAGGCLLSIILLIYPVIPAQAGIHAAFAKFAALWIPPCAGMTGYINSIIESRHPPASAAYSKHA